MLVYRTGTDELVCPKQGKCSLSWAKWVCLTPQLVINHQIMINYALGLAHRQDLA